MDTITVNNLISFVVGAIGEGSKKSAIFAAKGLDCPKEVKEHIINLFTNIPENIWDCLDADLAKLAEIFVPYYEEKLINMVTVSQKRLSSTLITTHLCTVKLPESYGLTIVARSKFP